MHPDCGPACECEYRKGWRAAKKHSLDLLGELYGRTKREADPEWEEKRRAQKGTATRKEEDELVVSLAGMFLKTPISDIRAALTSTTGSEAERLQQAITKLGKA